MALLKPTNKKDARKAKNTFTTRSGKTIKLHTSLKDRIKSSRDEKALRKAERLRGMPKSRIKRFFYRLHPKRVIAYWFSREGLIMGLKLTGIFIVFMFVLMVGVFAYFRKDLPNLRDISGNNIGGSIRYYDRTGKTLLWEDFDAVKRIPVQGDKISNYLKQATIALEDRDFYKHGGFDTRGITRAAWSNITGGGNTKQGGSTITQQLVKLSQDWTRDQSYTRKVKEIILAVELERSYSKEEILTGYLNTAPYGNIQYGAQTAAQDYFHKDAKDLTLVESIFLASIPQSPSFYSPYGAYFNEEFGGETGKQALIGRMHYTLGIMVEMGFITQAEADEAKTVDILKSVHKTQSRYADIKTPHFVLAAKEELEKKFSAETVNRSGWQVTTTVDLKLQKYAEEEVKNGLAQVKRQRGDVAAFVAEDVETGQIVALVGSPDFKAKGWGENNYARTPLPPGSSFKPYDYAALIENKNNVGAGTVIYDTRGGIPGYECKGSSPCLHDYDHRYPGPVTLRYALGGSRNVPAVKAMLMAGVDTTINTAEQLMNASNPDSYGYACYPPGTTEFIAENEGECYGSSAIGDGAYLKMDEHVHGMATFSRMGLNIPRTYILNIKDANGKTTYEWKLEGGTQVVRPDTAYIIADMMADPRASYMSAKRHRMPGKDGSTWKLALKTGTTNDSKDGWMVGYTTKYAAAVWVGYHNRQVELTGFMETMTQPILTTWMQRVHKNLKAEDWKKPGGIQELPAYVIRSHVGVGSVEPSPSTDLYPSWYQKKTSNGKKRIIDVISKKLASECTPDRAKKEETGAAAHSGDTFVTSGDSEDKDDVHKCSDDKPDISIGVSNSGGNYIITATISAGTHPLKGNGDKGGGKVEFRVNGNVVSTKNVAGSVSYTYGPDSSGDLSFSATVIDSVLYDSTSNAVSKSAPNLEFSHTGGTFVDFTWTGGMANVIRVSDGGSICGGNNSCTGSIDNGTVVYIQTTDGNSSPHKTISY